MTETSDSNGTPLLDTLRSFDSQMNRWACAISGWEGIFIGALTVVFAEEFVELVPLSDVYATLALFPTTLALLYILLFVAARYGRGGC